MKVRSFTPLILALTLIGCGGARHPGQYTGYVEVEYAQVGAPQSGWMAALHVREGDVVTPGTPLFDLDAEQQSQAVEEARARLAAASAQVEDASRGARPAEVNAYLAQLEEARAQLAYANSELARGERLEPGGAIAEAQLEQLRTSQQAAEAKVKAAEEAVAVARLAAREGVREAAKASEEAAAAAVGQAEYTLDQRSVIARVSGRVDFISHRAGEYVVAGSPVLSILPDNALKVRFYVPEAELPKLSVGQTVEVIADGLDAPVDARVSYIAPEAEFTPPVIYSTGSRDSLVFALEARLPDGVRLRAGLPVDVRLASAGTQEPAGNAK
ncbi:MAG: HlyD family efflux transporter periplasmic adaptor subunit [Hyphomonadaceae bacterium]